MKLPLVVTLGGLLTLGIMAPSHAVVAPSQPELGTSMVQEVAGRCGEGRHWVKAHRNRDGQRVRGRCVADRRHR